MATSSPDKLGFLVGGDCSGAFPSSAAKPRPSPLMLLRPFAPLRIFRLINSSKNFLCACLLFAVYAGAQVVPIPKLSKVVYPEESDRREGTGAKPEDSVTFEGSGLRDTREQNPLPTFVVVPIFDASSPSRQRPVEVSPTSIEDGAPQKLHFELPKTALAGGYIVQLGSGDTAIKSAPITVNVRPDRVRFFEAANFEQAGVVHAGPPYGVAFNPDGTFWYGGDFWGWNQDDYCRYPYLDQFDQGLFLYTPEGKRVQRIDHCASAAVNSGSEHWYNWIQNVQSQGGIPAWTCRYAPEQTVCQGSGYAAVCDKSGGVSALFSQAQNGLISLGPSSSYYQALTGKGERLYREAVTGNYILMEKIKDPDTGVVTERARIVHNDGGLAGKVIRNGRYEMMMFTGAGGHIAFLITRQGATVYERTVEIIRFKPDGTLKDVIPLGTAGPFNGAFDCAGNLFLTFAQQITPLDVPDSVILACVLGPQHKWGVTEQAALLAEVHDASAVILENDSQVRTIVLPLEVRLAGYTDVSLYLPMSEPRGSGELVNACVIARKSGQITLLSRVARERQTGEDDPNLSEKGYVNGDFLPEETRIIKPKKGQGPHFIAAAFTGEAYDTETPRHESRVVQLYRFDPANLSLVRVDVLDMDFPGKSGFTDSGEPYFCSNEYSKAPDDPRTYLLKERCYLIVDGKFQETSSDRLQGASNFLFGALSNPYVLPRGLLEKIADVDPKTGDAGCHLGELGLNEFSIYLGSPSKGRNTADQIDTSSVLVFGNPAKGPGQVRAEEVFPASYTHMTDAFGIEWTVKRESDVLMLPQIPDNSPYRCESGLCQHLVDKVYKFTVPACPVLRQLASELKTENSPSKLVIPITGQIRSGEHFQAYVVVRVVTGDWDNRFKPKTTMSNGK